MERFDVDADRILLTDAQTIELFWRGTNNGSSKWRIHLSHAGVEMSLNRKGDQVRVKVGERYGGGGVAGDIVFDIAPARSGELQAFFQRAGIQPV